MVQLAPDAHSAIPSLGSSRRRRYAGIVAAGSALPVAALAVAATGSAPLSLMIALGTAACIILADMMI